MSPNAESEKTNNVMKKYDVVVIGAGSGGLTAAVGFSTVGKRVLLIEREHMGGECTNSGCIPSKALLHHARAYSAATRIAGNTTASEDFRQAAFTYVRDTISKILAEETPATFEKLGIDVVLGEAEFVSTGTVEVAGTQYGYKTAIIATGSSPRLFEVPGLDAADVLTNQNIFDLETIPAKLLVIGAGPIGLEMGQALALLGSDVTIVTDGEVGTLEDPAIRPLLQSAVADSGVTFITNATMTTVVNKIATIEQTTQDNQTKFYQIHFDAVLIAIGRVPNLPVGLEKAGIAFDEHGVQVDSQHRTSNKYVYAIGDVAQRLKFTHVADDVARQVVTRVVSKGWLRVDRSKAVPKVTYTVPTVAQVGLSHEAAVAKYGAARVMRIEVPYTENDRAKTDNTTTGLLVVIARRLNGAVLGAHSIGHNAGELITPFTLALDNKISLWKLRRSIYAYPTYSLLIKKAGDTFFATQIGSLKADVIYVLKRSLPKIIAGTIWLALLYSAHRYHVTTGATVTDLALMLFTFISTTVWGPLLYIVAYALRPLIFFPGTVLTVLSGVFFGLTYGVLYTLIGATISAAVAYGVGRFFGSDLKLEDTVLGNWVETLRQNTFSTVLTLRLIFMPYDMVGYAAGIIKAGFVPFVTATVIGIVLGTTTFVAIGAALDIETFITDGFTFGLLEPRFLVLSAVIFIGSLVVSTFFKRWKAEAQ